jgi:DnaD/phage-associated family protein
MHYYANMDAIEAAVKAYYEGRSYDYANLEKVEIEESRISENDNLELEESLKSIEIQESASSSLNNSTNSSNNSTSRGRRQNIQNVDCLESPDPVFAEICMLWQSNIGALSPIIADEIKDLILEIPSGLEIEWFREAIKRGCAAGARKWNYIKKILTNWIESGGPNQDNRQAQEDSPSPLPHSPDLPEPEPPPPYVLIWEQAAGLLRSQLTNAAYNQVLGHCQPQPNHNGTFVLAVPIDTGPHIERVRKQILLALRQFKPEIKELEIINL